MKTICLVFEPNYFCSLRIVGETPRGPQSWHHETQVHDMLPKPWQRSAVLGKKKRGVPVKQSLKLLGGPLAASGQHPQQNARLKSLVFQKTFQFGNVEVSRSWMFDGKHR